jgi:O-antigen/teichoic acid export membrane protein
MITRRFVQSSLIYSIVGALPYTSGFILIFWFTRYLTPAQFGVNVLYLTLMYLVQIIATFGLDMSAAVMYIDYKKGFIVIMRTYDYFWLKNLISNEYKFA